MFLAAYHTDTNLYYPGSNLDSTPTVGYSWIWYHQEHWILSLFLNTFALVMFVVGLIDEKIDWKTWKSRFRKFYDAIKIDFVLEDKEDEKEFSDK